MSEQILVSRAAGVCELRFNRPEKRNAITFAMYQALCAALTEAQADEALRVVLLSGEGAGFCAGNDLQDFLSGPQFDTQHPVLQLLRMLATFGKPLVAAVHGQTVGIGVTMLLHCDLVVAATGTRLSMPFVALGLVPEAGSSLLLPRRRRYQRGPVPQVVKGPDQQGIAAVQVQRAVELAVGQAPLGFVGRGVGGAGR